MADEFDWSPFEGDRMSFDTIGDKIAGRLRDITVETGRTTKYPLLLLQVDAAGNTREVAGSPIDLKQQLAAIRPQVGWWIEIEFTGERQTGQPSPMKLFEVKANPPEKPEPAAAPAIEPDPLEDFSDEVF